MRKIFKYLDKPLLAITILLFAIGLIMVFSASNVTAYMSHAVSPYNYFFKQAIFLVIGFFLALIMIRFNTKAYGIFSWGLLIIATISLVILLMIGNAKNQALSWFDLGFASIQPSEFVKIITIVFLAHYYDKNQKRLDSWGKSLFPLGICGIITGLIFLQPDLGTTIIYCAIVGMIFLSVPIAKDIKFKTVFAIIGVMGCGIAALLGSGKGVLLERQMERFDFSNPCAKILSTGNQVCNCYIAINNGGLTGVGLGNSTQKYLYLPEPYTDFIYAIIVEELGIITGVFIILMYIVILFRILIIGRKSPSNRGAVLCYGITVVVALTMSWLLTHFVEKPGIKMAEKLTKKLLS